MRRPVIKWSGCCSSCGVHGDASSLFCYSAATGELAAIVAAAKDEKNPRKIESRFQFCDATKTDCLERWLSRHRKPAHASEAAGGGA